MGGHTPQLPTPHLGPPIQGEDQIASPIPFGWGHDKAHHILEIGAALRDNRHHLSYAWRILTEGVCDGCDMGSTGLHDDSLGGAHWCSERLRRLQINTQSAIPEGALNDIHRLRTLHPSELRLLGRLSSPMVYRPGDRGFSTLHWDEAIGLVSGQIKQTPPSRQAWIASPSGHTNEAFYSFAKAARAAGTHNVDLCTPTSHEQLIAGLRQQTGFDGPTCSIGDLVGTDLLLVFGDRIAHGPVSTLKALAQAKTKGTRIVVIGSSITPTLERTWVPSLMQSALLGSRLMDDAVYVKAGGELAFIHGMLKHVLALNADNPSYIDAHTEGWDQFESSLQHLRWESLEDNSGTRRREMEWVGELYARAQSCVSIFSTDFTRSRQGADNGAALVNLHLTRGMLGREKCGIFPFDSNAGTVGATSAGIHPHRLPNGKSVDRGGCSDLSEQWQFPLPDTPGMDTPDMIRACAHGEIDFVYSMGANLFHTLPDRNRVEQALENASLRVHQGIVLDTSMLIEPGEAVVLLPSTTRYEQRGGGSVSAIDRRIRFSPQIANHTPIGDLRDAWQIPGQIIVDAMPSMAHAFDHQHSHALRQEMGQIVPGFLGIESLVKPGDSIQPRGSILGRDGFIDRPNSRADFAAVVMPTPVAQDGGSTLIIRTHRDPFQFGGGRDELYIHPIDMATMGLADDDRVQVTSVHGTWHAHLRAHNIHPGVVQAHWPSCQAVLPPSSDVLEYTAAVTIEAL